VDPVILDAVEVARGPGAVGYGSDAFGGVIHLRTRRAVPGTPFGGTVAGSIGAGTPQQRAALALTRGFERGGVLLAGHYRNFDDWRSPQGEVINSGARDQGFLARVDHLMGGGASSVSWQSDLGRDIERPRTNSRTVRFLYPKEDSHRLSVAWERGRTGAFSKVGISGFAGQYVLVTDQDRFASGTQPRSIERADVSANDFHVRGYAQKPVGVARIEAGVDLNGRTNLQALEGRVRYDDVGQIASSTETTAIEDARRTDAGAYASIEAPVGRAFSFSGGFRGDAVATRNRGGYFGLRQTDNGALSGYAAATAGPFHGLAATVQVARGFRDPMLSDRYYRGPTGRGTITGNTDLDPEVSLQLDLTVRYSSRGLRAVFCAYDYHIRDLVERYQTEPDSYSFRNRGEARLRGVEAEVQARLPWLLSLELTGHRQRGEAREDGTGLDGISPATATARLRRSLGRSWVWVRLATFGRLERPGPTEERRPGHQQVDASLGFRLGSAEISVLGRNLLDEAWLVSPDSRAVLAPGRTGIVSMTLRL
jgi:outer membrane receptor protein involved in Fe transport